MDSSIIKIFEWWFRKMPLKQYYIKVLRPLTETYMRRYLYENTQS